MPVKAAIDIPATDLITVDNDVEIKIVRDEDGEAGIIFAVNNEVIVRLSPIDQWISYMIYTVMEESQALLEKEEPKPGWRSKNKS